MLLPLLLAGGVVAFLVYSRKPSTPGTKPADQPGQPAGQPNVQNGQKPPPGSGPGSTTPGSTTPGSASTDRITPISTPSDLIVRFRKYSADFSADPGSLDPNELMIFAKLLRLHAQYQMARDIDAMVGTIQQIQLDRAKLQGQLGGGRFQPPVVVANPYGDLYRPLQGTPVTPTNTSNTSANRDQEEILKILYGR